MKWETIPVRHELRNGLVIEAKRQNRSAASLAEHLLIKGGIRRLSDKKFQTVFATLEAKEKEEMEITVN